MTMIAVQSKSAINWKNIDAAKICWYNAMVNFFDVVVFLLSV